MFFSTSTPEVSFERPFHTLLRSDLNSHHIRAFNALIETQIPNVVDTYGRNISALLGIDKYGLTIDDVVVMNGQATLSNCFKFGMSHLVPVTAMITLSRSALADPDNSLPEVIARVRTVIGRIPLMTGANKLSNPIFQDLDPLTEDVFPGIMLLAGKMRTCPAVRSARFDDPILLSKRHVYQLQVRSSHFDKVFRSSSTLNLTIEKQPKRIVSVGMLYAKIPFQTKSINISVLFLAFGCPPQRAIELIKIFAGTRYDATVFRQFEVTMIHRIKQTTQREAILVISRLYGKSRLSTGANILLNEILPNCKADHTLSSEQHATLKVLMLAKLCVTLILFSAGRVDATDRDAYKCSMITSSAELIGQLFRLLFIAHVNTCGQLLRRALTAHEKKLLCESRKRKRHNTNSQKDDLWAEAASIGPIDLVKLYGESRLTARLISSVSNGTWSLLRKGVSISLAANNDAAIIGQLRRISSSLSATDGSHNNSRNVQLDQYGYICPSNSSSGDATGLVFELCVLATITSAIAREDVLVFCKLVELLLATWLIDVTQSVDDVQPDDYSFINAFGILTHTIRATDVDHLLRGFKELRRDGDLPRFAFIYIDDQQKKVRVLYQGGLLARPLVVMSRLKRLTKTMTFEDAVLAGCIEYTTVIEEQSLCKITVCLEDVRHFPEDVQATITHCELTQASLFGLMALTVPFVTGVQGPRVSYLTAQLKQFMCVQTIKQRRGNVGGTQLWHAHRNLVTTEVARITEMDVGKTTPCVVAIMCLPGCQEDAKIVKKSFIERGGMAGSTTRVYASDASNPTSVYSESFGNLDLVLSKKLAKYNKVNPATGVPDVGTHLDVGDVVISKTQSATRIAGSSSRQKRTMIQRRDISTVVKQNEAGIVVDSEIMKMPTGTRAVVTVSTPRFSEVGDKFSTYYAQKGCPSELVSEENMPFSLATGTTPDIIISPLSMTSRMTMAALLEAMLGKAVSVSGNYEIGIDKHEYDKSNRGKADLAASVLKENGFSCSGKEAYVDGRTGKIIEATIMTGVISYARLFHLSSRKLHARSVGPRDRLTRQPKDGKRFGGGLRSGTFVFAELSFFIYIFFLFVGEMEVSAMASHGASCLLQRRTREASDGYDLFICERCKRISSSTLAIEFFWCHHCETEQHILCVKVPFALLVLRYELMATGVELEFSVKVEEE
jgi:DNA-directed RNA polymerase beta subunit